MAVNSLFVLMCRYTHYVKIYPLGASGEISSPNFYFIFPGSYLRNQSSYEVEIWCTSKHLQVKFFHGMGRLGRLAMMRCIN